MRIAPNSTVDGVLFVGPPDDDFTPLPCADPRLEIESITYKADGSSNPVLASVPMPD